MYVYAHTCIICNTVQIRCFETLFFFLQQL